MWVWVWLWLPECEMMELWDARWLPMKEERRDKSTPVPCQRNLH